MRELRVSPRDRIVELGCGTGRHSIAQYNHTNMIVGIDLLPPRRVAFRQPNFRYQQGDACALPEIPDRAFDVALSFGMLEHIHPRDRLVAAIREAQRISDRYCFVVPHRYGFIEPHFLLPLFALWPEVLRSFVVRRFYQRPLARRNQFRRQINWLSKGEWAALFNDPNLRILDHWYGPVLLDYLIFGGKGLAR
jgi:SAM-dependent methyltransferase